MPTLKNAILIIRLNLVLLLVNPRDCSPEQRVESSIQFYNKVVVRLTISKLAKLKNYKTTMWFVELSLVKPERGPESEKDAL